MGDIDSARQAHAQLEQWRNDLTKWIDLLDAEMSTFSNGNPQSKTFSLLLQHISLLKPWFHGLLAVFPHKEPEPVPVTRLPYQSTTEYSLKWSQRVSHGEPKGVINRETDTGV